MPGKKIVIDSAALGAALSEIEHNCSMLVLSGDESAADDVGFYVPRIQRAAYDLRQLMKAAAPAKPPEISK